MLIILPLLFSLASSTVITKRSTNVTERDTVAMYWGQYTSDSTLYSLDSYCETGDVDIILLSFLSSFPNDIKFSFPCDTVDGTQHYFGNSSLANCTAGKISQDIYKCQTLGTKVFLSLGGESGSYGFNSSAQAEEFGTKLWYMFGEYNSTLAEKYNMSSVNRPFGYNITIDGFDFDIESKNNTKYYVDMAKQLKTHMDEASNDYYISAAPQCVYPDKSLNDLLTKAHVDYCFIQFYNNECNLDTDLFNWATWEKFAQEKSYNNDIQLFLGLPGSSNASSTGYISNVTLVENTVETILKNDSDTKFSGVMLWDAAHAFSSEVDYDNSTITYGQAMKDMLQKANEFEEEEQNSMSTSATGFVQGGHSSRSKNDVHHNTVPFSWATAALVGFLSTFLL